MVRFSLNSRSSSDPTVLSCLHTNHGLYNDCSKAFSRLRSLHGDTVNTAIREAGTADSQSDHPHRAVHIYDGTAGSSIATAPARGSLAPAEHSSPSQPERTLLTLTELVQNVVDQASLAEKSLRESLTTGREESKKGGSELLRRFSKLAGDGAGALEILGIERYETPDEAITPLDQKLFGDIKRYIVSMILAKDDATSVRLLTRSVLLIRSTPEVVLRD